MRAWNLLKALLGGMTAERRCELHFSVLGLQHHNRPVLKARPVEGDAGACDKHTASLLESLARLPSPQHSGHRRPSG
jgi:hypothetical protein